MEAEELRPTTRLATPYNSASAVAGRFSLVYRRINRWIYRPGPRAAESYTAIVSSHQSEDRALTRTEQHRRAHGPRARMARTVLI